MPRHATVLICLGLALLVTAWPAAQAENDSGRLRDSSATTKPAPPASPPQTRPQYPHRPDCAYPNRDWRCQPRPPGYHDPYDRRPVIINQIETAAPIDTSSLNDDWEGCRTAKLGAIQERNSGSLDRANRLDEWLWKNCRSYSVELRELEQNGM